MAARCRCITSATFAMSMREVLSTCGAAALATMTFVRGVGASGGNSMSPLHSWSCGTLLLHRSRGHGAQGCTDDGLQIGRWCPDGHVALLSSGSHFTTVQPLPLTCVRIAVARSAIDDHMQSNHRCVLGCAADLTSGSL